MALISLYVVHCYITALEVNNLAEKLLYTFQLPVLKVIDHALHINYLHMYALYVLDI